MQFLLYTNPRKVFLVGIDSSALGHFHNSQGTRDEFKNSISSRGQNLDKWAIETVSAWKELKEFAQIHYPETEIIWVNPVGLKVFFKDFYQDK